MEEKVVAGLVLLEASIGTASLVYCLYLGEDLNTIIRYRT